MKISEKVKTFIMAGVLALAGVGAALVPSAAVYADDISGEISKGVSGTGLTDDTDLKDIVKKVVNTILYVVGILSVVMMIFGGIQYTTSAGDQAKVTKAKNTILYGLVGLVVSLLAVAIVNFVINAVTGN